MSYEDPVDAAEFRVIRTGYSLESYRQSLVLYYTAPHSDLEVQQALGRWKVSEIRIFKDQQSLYEHEYLVATLHDADGKKIYLRIERRIRQASESQNGGEDRQGKTSKLAADDVSVCSSADLKFEQLQVDGFNFTDGSDVTLPRLIVLACMITEYCKSYHIVWRNCYWFCYVASEVLKQLFPHEQLSIEGSCQQGCWHGITTGICSQVNKAIKDLLENYNETWDKFIQEVDTRINNPNNKYTLDAKAEAEAQKRRADEETRRADEATRQADDNRHEVEYLRRQLKLAYEQQAGTSGS